MNPTRTADAQTQGQGRGARPTPTVQANLLGDYPELLAAGISHLVDDPAAQTGDAATFSPGFALPDPDDPAVREFYAAAVAGWSPLADYRGHRLTLLDLTLNPGTNTTKTFASLTIVARAVEHLRRTGEKVMIFSPTSANKGTALRDAVARAYAAGLATPEQLRIVVLAPRGCRDKLRAGPLSEDPRVSALNPLLLYAGERPEDVKAIGREFVDTTAATIASDHGWNVWYSLDLRNYLIADTARAFFEQEVDPTEQGLPRMHAHAVSSAFGLLGYHAGREVLEEQGLTTARSRPQSLLVQHMATSDMVLSLLRGDFDRSGLPGYAAGDDGLSRQQGDEPHFPLTTFDTEEVLDPTFYTHRPATSPRMNDIIASHGGSGIVVSLHECLERYPLARAWMADHPRPLPADPRQLKEWSLLMAITGVCNAIDRGILDEGREVVIHGSGWYSTADFELLPDAATRTTNDVDAVRAAVLESLGGPAE